DESYDWVAMENTSRVGAATFGDADEPEIVEVQDQNDDDLEDEDTVICHGQQKGEEAATFGDADEPEIVEVQDQNDDGSEDEDVVICHGQ
ncbi:hypothetical protein H0H93_003817, partial [Arthromyces matolae]